MSCWFSKPLSRYSKSEFESEQCRNRQYRSRPNCGAFTQRFSLLASRFSAPRPHPHRLCLSALGSRRHLSPDSQEKFQIKSQVKSKRQPCVAYCCLAYCQETLLFNFVCLGLRRTLYNTVASCAVHAHAQADYSIPTRYSR